MDARQVGLEDRLQAALVAASGEGRETPPKPPDPAGLHEGQHHEQEDRDGQGGDDRAEVVANDGVEIDGRLLEVSDRV